MNVVFVTSGLWSSLSKEHVQMLLVFSTTTINSMKLDYETIVRSN